MKLYRKNRINLVVVGKLSLLLAIYCFSAVAKGTPIEYKIGAALDFVYDDNIFLERVAISKDYIIGVKPFFELASRGKKLTIAANYQPFFSYYLKNYSDNRLKKFSHGASLTADYQFSEAFRVSLADYYYLTTASEAQPDFSRIEVYQNNLLTIKPSYKFLLSERQQLEFSTSYTRRDIEEIIADYHLFAVGLRYQRELNANYLLSLTNQLERRVYDQLDSDFYLYTAYLSLDIDLARRLEAKIPLGYQLMKVDGPGGAEHNFSYAVKLKYFITPRLVFLPEFNQLYSADLSGQVYNSRILSGRLDYDFSARLAGTIGGEWREIDYFDEQSVAAKDRLIILSAKLTYQISEKSIILVGYDRADNGGAYLDNNFEGNRYKLEFKYTFAGKI